MCWWEERARLAGSVAIVTGGAGGSAPSSYVTGTTLDPDGGTTDSSGWFRRPGSGSASRVPTKPIDWLFAEDS